VNIFERKQEARNPFYRVVALDDNTSDPAVGQELSDAVRRLHPHRRPGAHALRRQRGGAAHATDVDPRSVVADRSSRRIRVSDDVAATRSQRFREERGHAYMLLDQTYTERQRVVKQPGTCINCTRRSTSSTSS